MASSSIQIIVTGRGLSWWWTQTARNGLQVARSRTYGTRAHAVRAARRQADELRDAIVVVAGD